MKISARALATVIAALLLCSVTAVGVRARSDHGNDDGIGSIRRRLAALEARGTSRNEMETLAIGLSKALAKPTPNKRAGSISLDGVGRVETEPDVMIVSVRIQTKRSTAGASILATNRAAKAVARAFREDGVAQRDIRTTSISVNSHYDYRERRDDGYVAINALTVRLRKLDDAGVTIGHAAKAGGDAVRVGPIRFALEKADTFVRRARRLATLDVRDKAKQYAALMGRELGRVRSISESLMVPGLSNGDEGYALEASSSGSGDGYEVPISVGVLEVLVRTSVEYALE